MMMIIIHLSTGDKRVNRMSELAAKRDIKQRS